MAKRQGVRERGGEGKHGWNPVGKLWFLGRHLSRRATTFSALPGSIFSPARITLRAPAVSDEGLKPETVAGIKGGEGGM